MFRLKWDEHFSQRKYSFDVMDVQVSNAELVLRLSDVLQNDTVCGPPWLGFHA